MIKIDPYNFELYRFKVGPFFETQCICNRPVRPSLRHMSGSVKTVKVRIVQFPPYGCPTSSICVISFIQKFKQALLSGDEGIKKGGPGKMSHFLANVSISKMVGDMSKITIND